MSFYQEIKTMKGAVIGTIMAWSGGLSDIPDGWIVCDGSEKFGRDFPLLARAIGDTYRTNNASDALGGGFPAYRNNGADTRFVLPDLTTGKALMDMEAGYFNDPSTGIDTATAANLVVPYIGDNSDNGVPRVFAGGNALKTDVEFTLNARNGYGGNIRGNTIIDGIGEKVVYIGGRKLGHQHIRSHSHPGQLDTVTYASANRPGGGVIPWDKWEMRFGYRAYNETTDPDAQSDSNDQSAIGGLDTLKAIYGWFYSDTEYQIIDAASKSAIDSISGFNQGPLGRSIGSASCENPPINLSAQQLTARPIASLPNWSFKNLSDSSIIEFGQGGNTLNVPAAQRNSYASDGGNAKYGTLLSNTVSDWGIAVDTGGAQSNSVLAHGHDPFIIEYDQATLKPNSRIVATASIPLETVLDNNINKGALEITMNTSQPSLTCVYIIRAY
jgi:hypothetical protein